MALVRHRFGPEGLYILDEPEAALSIGTQCKLLGELERLVTQGCSQIVVSTHSLVLPALKDCTIYEFSRAGIECVRYRETAAYRLAKTFLDGRVNES
jgi:predicted ATPase